MDEIAHQIEPLIPALRRHAWALLRDADAADDLVQDTLERAIGRWTLRRGDLRAWLFAIQRNLFLSGLRAGRRRGGRHLGSEALEEVAGDEGRAEAALGARDVLAALDRLPEEQRSVLLLVGVEELSYADAARVLGIPPGTVMSRLSRARQALRRATETGRVAFLRRVK